MMTLAPTYVLCQPGMEERADERDNKERQVHKHVKTYSVQHSSV